MTKTSLFDDIDKNYIFDIIIYYVNEYTTAGICHRAC
jgi:hypothetical protein